MKKKLILLFIPFFYFFTSLPARSALDEFSKYKSLNDSESRYIEYKDSDEILRIKLQQLDYINAGRAKYNAPPVELDILASRVANRMCIEAVEENFRGHWNTRGEKPYHRYAFAGGVDHISENASAEWSSGNFDHSPETIFSMMKKANDRFMNEIAPNDGHKKNCIDPVHNYVGLGVYMKGGQFRYYEEFIDRYLEFRDFEDSAAVKEEYLISVKPLSSDHLIYFTLIYYERFPSPMAASQINRKGSYGDYTSSQVLQQAPWELPETDEEGWTNFSFRFSRSGLYYINIYLSEELWTSGRASTNGKIQASGVVVRVE